MTLFDTIRSMGDDDSWAAISRIFFWAVVASPFSTLAGLIYVLQKFIRRKREPEIDIVSIAAGATISSITMTLIFLSLIEARVPIALSALVSCLFGALGERGYELIVRKIIKTGGLEDGRNPQNPEQD